MAEEIGADRTGIRLSPGATLGGLDEGAEGPELYRYLVRELNKLGLAYIHIMHLGNDALLADLRALWNQALILNRPGRALEDVGSDVRAGLADLEAYGQFVLSTPDFVERLKINAAMNVPDRTSFYGGSPDGAGYIDYLTLSETAGAK